MNMIKTFTFIILGLFCSNLMAQTQISGKVTDNNNEPLTGANISLKDGVIGTITDTDGNFELTVKKAPPLTLIFSFI